MRGLTTDNPSSLYPLANGYDMATGLGTPIGTALGPSLACGGVHRHGRQPRRADIDGRPARGAGDPRHRFRRRDADVHRVGPPRRAHDQRRQRRHLGHANGIPGTFTVTVSADDQFANSAHTTFAWIARQPRQARGRPTDALQARASGTSARAGQRCRSRWRRDRQRPRDQVVHDHAPEGTQRSRRRRRRCRSTSR